MNQLMKQRSTFTSLLPLLMKIVETALTMPISNAWPERGASRVKLIKTRLRSRMTNDMLEGLLNISINGSEVNSPDCDALIKKTADKCLSAKRYKLAKGKSKGLPSKTSEALIESAEVSTQTDNQQEDPDNQAQIEQEEEQAIIKLGLAQYTADDSDSDRDSAMGDSDFSDSEF